MPPPRTAIDPDALSRALRHAMTRRGYTQGTLAKLIGERTGKQPAQSTVSNWTRGEKVPSTRLLPVVLDALGLSWTDIGVDGGSAASESQGDLRGNTQGNLQGAPTSEAAAVEAASPSQSTELMAEQEPMFSELGVVLIPCLARASAGDGYLNGDHSEIESYHTYPLDEIRRLTHANPDHLRAIKAVGDSMEPEILANSTVIYVPTEEVAEHGLYVFAIDEALLIKKIQLYSGGALEIIPINPTYSREMLLPLKEADEPNTYRSQQTGLVSRFRVVGRVVFYTKAA